MSTHDSVNSVNFPLPNFILWPPHSNSRPSSSILICVAPSYQIILSNFFNPFGKLSPTGAAPGLGCYFTVVNSLEAMRDAGGISQEKNYHFMRYLP